MVNLEMVERTLRHAGIIGIPGVLHNRDPTAFLDGDEPCRAIIKHPCEHNPNDAWTMRDSGGAKQWVYCRTIAVFPRSLCHQEFVLLDQ
jgi:hypothetical protein